MRLARWIWLALYAAGVSARSSSGDRVLVVVPTPGAARDYSDFISSLEARGFELAVRGAANASVVLHGGDGARLYDHAVLLAPESKRLGALTARSLVRFVDDGGNLLVTAGSDASPMLRTLAAQFGVTLEKRGSRVVDHVGASSSGDAGTVVSARYAHVPAVLSAQLFAADAPPVHFEGVGLRSSDIPQLVPVLSAPRTAYSTAASDDEAPGSALGLVSVFQSRGNARVGVSGSAALFSDRLMRVDGAGNRQFAADVSLWVLQEKSVLRASSLRHALATGERPEHYRVSSDVVFEVDLAEFRKDAWHAYNADDVQLELTMLDPYVRTTLNHTHADDSADVTTYRGDVRLPDRYGTFTFRVNYKRPGLSNVDVRDVVGIRPPRHDEYPRFLTAAYPYYASALALAVGFLGLSAVWLWSAEPKAVADRKAVTDRKAMADRKPVAEPKTASEPKTKRKSKQKSN
ncbi:oligosaccharyl transferase glycoprotein complex, beta subunit [Coemansia sp. RSA 2618]|nr:oligosaccharyl transferase glycoprotein complex, beta subunit [Coemansia sp. RSA 2618]